MGDPRRLTLFELLLVLAIVAFLIWVTGKVF